ncbi:unnamed protein product, partial [Mesorhabditis spiculigera]
MLRPLIIIFCAVNLRNSQIIDDAAVEGSGFGDDPCPPKLDVAFVLDTSGSIEEVYREHIKWTIQLADSLPINSDAVRLAGIQYAGFPLVEFSLNEVNSSADAIVKLKNITFQSGVTRTGYALRKTESELTRPEKGARGDAKKCIVLFTDGLSIDDPLKASEHLRLDRGIKIYVVSVGSDGFEPEMERIAGDHGNTFGPQALAKLQERLLKDVEAARVCANGQSPPPLEDPLVVRSLAKGIIKQPNELKRRNSEKQTKPNKPSKNSSFSAPGRAIATIVSGQESATQIVGTQQIRLQDKKASPKKEEFGKYSNTNNEYDYGTYGEKNPSFSRFSPENLENNELGSDEVTGLRPLDSEGKRVTTTRRIFTRFTSRSSPSTTIATTKRPTTTARTATTKPPTTTRTKHSRALAARNFLASDGGECPLDILFIVDSSGSVVTVYDKQKAFLLELLSNIDVSQQAHRVALLQFAGVKLQKTDAFGHVRHITGTTYIGAALESAKILLESRRREAQTIVVLLSDGFSQDDPLDTAGHIARLPNTDFYVASVAENNNNEMLQRITDDAEKVYVGKAVDELKQKLIRRFKCRV